MPADLQSGLVLPPEGEWNPGFEVARAMQWLADHPPATQP